MIRKARNQAGDTIVEVLIAIAIISLVLAGAYVSTNRNTKSVLDAQEHAQALKLVETQVEFLRAAAQATTSYTFPAGKQCFDQSGKEANTCLVGSDGGSVSPGQVPAYSLTVANPTSTGAPFTISAVWDTPVDSEPGNVTLLYRPY